jgi:putative flippase GtrA
MAISNRFIKFVLVSGFAAGVNIVARYLFNLAVAYEMAIVLAFFCGLATAFLLNRAFVFETQPGTMHRQGFRFALVNLVALGQVALVSLGLARVVFPAIGMGWRPEDVAHVIGVLSPVATSYLAHKQYSFADAATNAGTAPPVP